MMVRRDAQGKKIVEKMNSTGTEYEESAIQERQPFTGE